MSSPRVPRRTAGSPPRGVVRRAARWTVVVAGGMALLLVAYGAWLLVSLTTGLIRSAALGESNVQRSHHGDLNFLLMGLDSRVDENGHALPAHIYQALHAGDATDGGQNANVLILLHLPGNGAPATALSIPRDDYTTFPGCPDGQCAGKIKQAYGLAFDAKARELGHTSGSPRGVAREQALRDAGRSAEIATVSQFLGGVPIDHFVEVTMVAFYQVAQVVQPITVCVGQATSDTFSGADFRQGRQQINASQALAFVRQRRDTRNPGLNFTDLDRERRQQAFISSLAYQLKQASTFVDPRRLGDLVGIAKQNIAVDTSLNLLSFARDAQSLAGGRITFYTLPIQRFGRDRLGEDVNFVDLPVLQATVRQLLSDAKPGHGPSPSASPSPAVGRPSPTRPPAGAVSVVNASGRRHLAATVKDQLHKLGFATGGVGTAATQVASEVRFAPGSDPLAAAVAKVLGNVPARVDGGLAVGTARVVLGTDFRGIAGPAPSAAPSRSVPLVAVPATGTGALAPAVTQLTALSGGGIRCVK